MYTFIMDINVLSVLGSALAIIAFIYRFMRNFRKDTNRQIDKIDNQINRMERRMEMRMDNMDQKIFWTLTGKKLEDVILEQKIKRTKNKKA